MGGEMDTVFTLDAVDRWLEPQSDQTKHVYHWYLILLR